jgi:hypothetical protein
MISKVNKSFLYLIVLIVFYSNLVQSRPVSYPGGKTVMLMNNAYRNTMHLHYSPTSITSFGYKFEHWRKNKFIFNGIQINNLIKRFNKPESQANFYIKSGLGSSFSLKNNSNNKQYFSGFAGIAVDWETQRFFVAYENRYTEAGETKNFLNQSVKLGLAPYIGDYGDLHTWLMLNLENTTIDDEILQITPNLRFFKGTHMLEVGTSLKGKTMINYIFRY